MFIFFFEFCLDFSAKKCVCMRLCIKSAEYVRKKFIALAFFSVVSFNVHVADNRVLLYCCTAVFILNFYVEYSCVAFYYSHKFK